MSRSFAARPRWPACLRLYVRAATARSARWLLRWPRYTYSYRRLRPPVGRAARGPR